MDGTDREKTVNQPPVQGDVGVREMVRSSSGLREEVSQPGTGGRMEISQGGLSLGHRTTIAMAVVRCGAKWASVTSASRAACRTVPSLGTTRGKSKASLHLMKPTQEDIKQICKWKDH